MKLTSQAWGLEHPPAVVSDDGHEQVLPAGSCLFIFDEVCTQPRAAELSYDTRGSPNIGFISDLCVYGQAVYRQAGGCCMQSLHAPPANHSCVLWILGICQAILAVREPRKILAAGPRGTCGCILRSHIGRLVPAVLGGVQVGKLAGDSEH